MPDLITASLILRLLLKPDDLARVRILAQNGLVFLRRKRIQVLDSYDRHRLGLRLAPRFQQVEINLAAAEHDALYLGGPDVVDLIDHRLETVARQFLQTRHGQRMAQQALGRHDDERLAQRAQHLPAQHVEHLRRRRGNANLHVELGAELQKSLEARRGVFRTLAFVAMRQEQGDAGHAAPLGFPRADELVDDDLRTVAEIAELALPNS